jgi:hypothetical protein
MLGPERRAAAEPREGERPWERPEAVRRDCPPHRGPLLLLLGYAALVLSLSGVCLLVTSWLAVALACTVAWLAWRDLERMDLGEMDPGGRDQAETARVVARVALSVGVPSTLLLGLLFGLGVYVFVARLFP